MKIVNKTLSLAMILLLAACAPQQIDIANPQDDPIEISWAQAVDYINNGKVASAWQTHSLKVKLVLKNGQSVKTTEPAIDEVFRVIEKCGKRCSQIAKITE